MRNAYSRLIHGVVVVSTSLALVALLGGCLFGGPETVPLASGAGGGAFLVSNGSDFGAGLLGGTLTFNADGALTDYEDGSGWTLTGGTSPDYGADGTVAWGRWSAGTSEWTGISGSVLTLHYAVSEEWPDATTLYALNKTYNAFASTQPTIESQGVITAGDANGVTGSLTLNKATDIVTYSLEIVVKTHRFSLNGTGAFATAGETSDNRLLGNGTVTSSSGDVSGGSTGVIPYGPYFQGGVWGSQGERVVGEFAFTSDIGTVSGAVVFK